MPRPRKYSPELLDRGARVVIESGRPIAHVARDLGLPSETLRKHVRRVEADQGRRPDLPTAAEREEIKRLRREVYELRRANEILKAALSQAGCDGDLESGTVCPGGSRGSIDALFPYTTLFRSGSWRSGGD